jgi:5-methylcytosine-specific restriction endonuclease McrA
MPYALISDSLGRDPRWHALAGGKRAVRDQLQAAYVRMLCETASHLHDGYLTRHQALACADDRAQTVDLLCTPVLGEKPFLHRPDDECNERNCIDDSGPWVAGFDYRVCGFNKRNPTRGEWKRNKAQKADSRDARLRGLVYDRDAGCCRYCRSGPLKKRGMGRARDRRRVLQYDHPDPDLQATPPGQPEGSNYVVACARCNELKGHRTPAEAGLVLLQAPTDEQKAAWHERGERLFDLPDAPADNDNDKQHDNAHDKQHDKQPSFVPSSVPSSVSDTGSGVETAGQAQEQAPGLSSEGSGSGRGGQSGVVRVDPAAGQPARAPDAPDIYSKRSRRGGRNG